MLDIIFDDSDGFVDLTLRLLADGLMARVQVVF